MNFFTPKNVPMVPNDHLFCVNKMGRPVLVVMSTFLFECIWVILGLIYIVLYRGGVFWGGYKFYIPHFYDLRKVVP